MSFWSIQDSYWRWKKILNLSSTVKPLLKCEVGSSCRIFLWNDWWNPVGVLIRKNGTWVIYDGASGSNERVSSVLKEKLSLEASKMRWPCIYYSKLCWCIKVLKMFQIKPGTYSSAESLKYIRDKLLLLVIKVLKNFQLHVGMQITIQNQVLKTSRSVAWGKNI